MAGEDSKLMLMELSVDVEKIEDSSLQILSFLRPQWTPNSVKFKYFTDGITNKLVGCYTDADKKDVILIRVNGEGTEMIIDREAEVNTFQTLRAAKCGPPLYAVFTNGMAYGFFEGEPLDEQLVRDDKVAKLIAQKLVKLHGIQPNGPKPREPSEIQSQYQSKTQSYLNMVPTKFHDPVKHSRLLAEIPAVSMLQAELNDICSHLQRLNMPVVFSHNDLLLKNIIYDQDNSVIHFIDYEYAFMNYEAYDIGNHFCEYAGMGDETNYDLYPDKAYQMKWLRNYLEAKFSAQGKSPSEVTDSDVERLYVQTSICACAAHFFWGLWALIQAKISSIDFDYLGYGATRLKEYFRRKPEFFALQLP